MPEVEKDPIEGKDETVKETVANDVLAEDPGTDLPADVKAEEDGPTEEKGPQIDYQQYGYRTSETIPIPSVLFYEILGIASLVEQDPANRKLFYEDRPTMEETFSEQNTPVNFLTTLGMKAKALRFQLNQVHISNVDSGIATPISVLQEEAKAAQAPAVTLEDDPAIVEDKKETE